MTALNEGDVEAARAAATALLAQTPADPAAAELGAIAAHRSGRQEEAVALARRSLAIRPDHLATVLLLGRACRALGRWPDAARAFEQVLTLAPDRAEAAFLLGATWLQAGDRRAGPLLDSLLARSPGDPGWEEIGEVLLAAGKRPAALLSFGRAAAGAAAAPQAMRLGERLHGLGEPSAAVAAFRRAVDLDPHAARGWFRLGLAAQDAGDTSSAVSAYRTALDREPGLAEAAVNLGAALQDGGDLPGAKAAYGQALRLRPDTFGRIAQAMTTSPKGELWLDLGRLRQTLAG